MVFKKGEKKSVGKTSEVAKKTPVEDKKKEKAVALAGRPRKLKSKNIETYSVYIYRVLKQVHPETGISKRSMSIMNSFINDIFEKIAA